MQSPGDMVDGEVMEAVVDGEEAMVVVVGEVGVVNAALLINQAKLE